MTAKSRHTKGWLIALVILAILVALVLFAWLWLLPYYIEKRLVDTFASLTGREVSIEQVSIDPFDAQVTLDRLRIAGEADQPVLASETIVARLQWPSLWESGWRLDSLTFEDPRLRLVRQQDGEWNLVHLFAGKRDANRQKTPIRIARIEARQGRLDLVNRRLAEPVTLTLGAIRMSAENYDNTNARPFTLQGQANWNGGTLNGQGEMGFAPWTLDLDFTLNALPLTTLSGYVEAFSRARVTGGELSAALVLQAGRAGDEATRVRGDGDIVNPVLSYPEKDEPLAKAQRLDIDGLYFDSGEKTLDIQRLALISPWTEVVIDENLKTNLDVWQPPPRENDAQEKGLGYAVAEISLDGGGLAFADRHLSQPFSLDFSRLDGSWKNLNSGTPADGRVAIAGQVSGGAPPDGSPSDGSPPDGAPLRIQGMFDPLGEAVEGDLQLQFEQLNLAVFSPYARRFGGYAIEQGQGTLRLDFRIEKGQLMTNNRLELRRIELGEQVEDSAGGGLPLRTLIDMLQTDDGVIELDVPMTLPLDNPSAVKVGEVMDDAIDEALENVLSSPLETLSETTGIGDERESDEKESDNEPSKGSTR